MKNASPFTQFIEETLGHDFDYESVWDWAEEHFDLKQSKSFQISKRQCILSYECIKNKYLSKLIADWPHEWHKNQKKFFLRVLLCFCKSQQKHPTSMSKEDWQYMSSIFFGKDPQFLKFQAYQQLKLGKKQEWGPDDDQLIQQYVSKCHEGNWREISKLIFYKTDKAGCNKFYSTKQIRERWNNHVRSNLNKGAWTHEEDILLLEHVLYNNRRWSEITRLFNKQRTEHMIKNRYNFLTVKYGRHQLKKPAKILKLLQQIKQKDNFQKAQKEKQARILKNIQGKDFKLESKPVQKQQQHQVQSSEQESNSPDQILPLNPIKAVQQNRNQKQSKSLQQSGYPKMGTFYFLPIQNPNVLFAPISTQPNTFPYMCMPGSGFMNMQFANYNPNSLINGNWFYNEHEETTKLPQTKQHHSEHAKE